MKKIRLLLMLFVLVLVLNVSAVNLSDLESDKETYLNVENTIETSRFLDVKNYEVVRYNPPYYVIKFTHYDVYYGSNQIYGYIYKYYYDINTKEIKCQINKVVRWGFDGKVEHTRSYKNELLVSLPNDDSVLYYIGATMFDKAYNNSTFLDNYIGN